jgi:hypothetical protein
MTTNCTHRAFFIKTNFIQIGESILQGQRPTPSIIPKINTLPISKSHYSPLDIDMFYFNQIIPHRGIRWFLSELSYSFVFQVFLSDNLLPDPFFIFQFPPPLA